MKKLTPQQELIYNDGERLIPGVTHDLDEEIRHRSSYRFFRKIIENDIASSELRGRTITILDLGCGTGHGSRELAEISGSRVTGVDISPDSIAYAKENYCAGNVDYLVADMQKVIAEMPVYDYIVSRHAIEHVPDGLDLCLSLKWGRRMMINVPYNEPPGNEYHVLTEISKDSFPKHPGTEFFYEDLHGVTFYEETNAEINSIVGIYSDPALPSVSQSLAFPYAAWTPSEFQILHGRALQLETKVSQLEARIIQLDSQLAETNSLLLIRIMRKIRRMF